MLVLKDVSKAFGGTNPYEVLSGIDFSIDRGEFVCLLGASGCGKSTLLNILAGFEPVTSGRITLDGELLAGKGRDGVMVFQDATSALFPWLNVEANVRLGLKLKRVPALQIPPIIDKFLTITNLSDHRHKFPYELSGGMRQRLQIARALAVDPQLLLMDEPFAALDAITRRRMHAELTQIWKETGKTVIFVTHDIAEAITLADRIAIMKIGPRSRIEEVIKVDLPRPRLPSDPAFGTLFSRIEASLAGESKATGSEAHGHD